MDYDTGKIDDTVLALLYLTIHGDRAGARAWKTHDWDAMDRLHAKGYIGNPKSKAKSVAVTDEGVARAKRLFRQLFSKSSAQGDSAVRRD
jgi:hypothetical protein